MSRLEEVKADIDEWEHEDSSLQIAGLRLQSCALAAEVDELQRRLDAIVKMLEPGKCSCNCVGELGPKCECSNTGNMRDVEAWWTTYCLHARAVALAEGRESG